MALLIGLTAACGSQNGSAGPPTDHALPPTASDPLPPRPDTLPILRIDPCTLLTAEQLEQLGVGGGRASESDETDTGPACIWTRFPEEPQDGYLIAADGRSGAAQALGSVTGARIVTVAGYGGVETQLAGYPEQTHCLVLVDVADGQNLWVQYDYDGSTVPMTRELACEKARNAAGMAVQTLRVQAGG